MSVARTQVTPQEWARGQPALQSPGGTPASSHSHGGTPGPNGGSQAPPRPPTRCVCPECGVGRAAYPRGAGSGSPRRSIALWGRESREGVRKGLDTQGQRELGSGWRGGPPRGAASHPLLPGGLGKEDGWPGSPAPWCRSRTICICSGSEARAPSNFSMTSSSTSGVLAVGAGRQARRKPQP